LHRIDEAVKHIKRIVIWPSTDLKIKALYKELVKLDARDAEELDVIDI